MDRVWKLSAGLLTFPVGFCFEMISLWEMRESPKNHVFLSNFLKDLRFSKYFNCHLHFSPFLIVLLSSALFRNFFWKEMFFWVINELSAQTHKTINNFWDKKTNWINLIYIFHSDIWCRYRKWLKCWEKINLKTRLTNIF